MGKNKKELTATEARNRELSEAQNFKSVIEAANCSNGSKEKLVKILQEYIEKLSMTHDEDDEACVAAAELEEQWGRRVEGKDLVYDEWADVWVWDDGEERGEWRAGGVWEKVHPK